MLRFFENRIDPFPPAPPRTPPTGLLAFLRYASRPVLPWLGLMSVLTALVSTTEIALFGYMGTLVDRLTDAEPSTFFAEHGRELAAIALLVGLGLPALVFAQSLVIHQTIFGNYPMLVRWLGHRHMLRQSLRFYQDELAGRISQKIMQTAISTRETVTTLMDVMVYVVVYFTGTLVLVAQTDVLLTVPLLVWLGGYVTLLYYFVPRLRTVSMEQSDARATMTGRIVDSYTNIQTIKLFAHTESEQQYAREAMGEFMITVHRQMRLVTGLTVSLQTLNAMLLVGIGGMAIWAWNQAAATLGAIAVAIALIMRIRSMSNWILWEIAQLFEHIGTVQDGIKTLAQPLTVTDRRDAGELTVSRGEIRFANVSFDYAAEAGVIDNLSLHIRPGEKVGLVGRSGAGKSTLVNLLLRFYDVQSGRITIDGQNIADVTQESLRRHIGMVTQDTSLLHRSIRDNIRYGRPDATDAEIIEAAKRAHAHEFILGLVDKEGRTGYDAHAGERGVKLSGGQRQRIAIARVLLKNAPILVLDEATSALDSEIEAAIQEQLYALMQDKTVIAIAHRLSTIAALDRLIVIDDGRIVESGSHDELLALGGLYAKLWQHQSGGFLACELEDIERAGTQEARRA